MMHNMCDFPPTEETAKHSAFDDLSAKVQVLEAENESLKTFIKESSEKETLARKELSEKHARDMVEFTDKLKKSQQRVTSLVAKNKSQEAEAEAIDKMIFRNYPSCYSSDFLICCYVRGKTDHQFHSESWL
jgi:3'-phosphoadenosine 5'-phosphosulfate (PAPS) 3'-phosphatase